MHIKRLCISQWWLDNIVKEDIMNMEIIASAIKDLSNPVDNSTFMFCFFLWLLFRNKT